VYLLDLALPLMSGRPLARRIRERTGGDSVRPIAVTAWGAERDRHRDAPPASTIIG
jgi:DNA-binding response OmpR family regulator